MLWRYSTLTQSPCAFMPIYRFCCFTDDAAVSILAHATEGDGSASMGAEKGSEATGMAGWGSP